MRLHSVLSRKPALLNRGQRKHKGIPVYADLILTGSHGQTQLGARDKDTRLIWRGLHAFAGTESRFAHVPRDQRRLRRRAGVRMPELPRSNGNAVPHVRLDGEFAQEELGRDVLVRLAGRDRSMTSLSRALTFWPMTRRWAPNASRWPWRRKRWLMITISLAAAMSLNPLPARLSRAGAGS
jgi:hypothetical protein